MPLQNLIPFDNSFAKDMEGFYVAQNGDDVPNPKIVQFNNKLAEELGLNADDLNSSEGAAIFAGSKLAEGSEPLAQVYAGHQFGGFSPQLGDGRALLLGEILDRDNFRRDIQLKGSGRTPFSRNGDGKAALAPVLREYLMGEAMHALGVPTTRALVAVITGEKVYREDIEEGAVLTRIASSHLRVGSFQFFAARQETDYVKKLADYAINRHYPDLASVENPYLELLKTVAEVQASLIAKWVSIGFIHGVMNTDNMTISGETIDYGPCAFMDVYDPKAVFSSIDEYGRYAYGNQPNIAQWNLARFAETLIMLIDEQDSDAAIKLATDVIQDFPQLYQEKWLEEMRRKFGFVGEQDGDVDLINDFHELMNGQNVDFTSAFRQLANTLRGNEGGLLALFDDAAEVNAWVERWKARIAQSGSDQSKIADTMDTINPIYIPRNHLIEEVLQSARSGDYSKFQKLLSVLEKPFEKRDGLEAYELSAPETFGPYVTYCGT